MTVRLRDGNLLGLGSKNDTLEVLRNNVVTSLGSVNLKADYVKGGKTVQWNATMVASTTTVNGTTATVVTITLKDLGEGRTQLTFHQAFFLSEASRDGHAEGWEETLDNLERYLAA